MSKQQQSKVHLMKQLYSIPPAPGWKRVPKVAHSRALIRQLPSTDPWLSWQCKRCDAEIHNWRQVNVLDRIQMKFLYPWKEMCEKCANQIITRWEQDKKNPKYRQMAERYMLVVRRLRGAISRKQRKF